jgi:hypothetical protein
MVARQYNSTGLINKHYRCYFTRPRLGHVMLQTALARLSLACQQSKCKVVFFTSATVFRCLTLPGISFLLSLPGWNYGYISRFFSDKRIDSISSGEQFPAGQWPFRSKFSVKRRHFRRRPSSFATLWTSPTPHMAQNMCQEPDAWLFR